MIVKCPNCGKPTEYNLSNRFRPFCSKRCKIIDLGAWADEKYKVPVKEQDSESVNGHPDAPNDSSELN
jgi:uncharacterized protein